MSIYEGVTNVVSNYETAEYGKFLQLTSSDFPAISVTRVEYPDNTQAFPGNTAARPITSTDVYPKYAVLSHITNPSDISQVVNISGSNVAINLAPLTATNATLASLLANNQTLLAQEAQSFIALSAIDLNTFDTLTAVAAFNNSYLTSLPVLTSVSIANPVSTYNNVTNWDVLSAAINSSTYTTLPSNPANEITILNNTGGTMYIKNASKSIGLPIDNNTSVDLRLVGDTSEVAIKASSNNKTVFATFISYN